MNAASNSFDRVDRTENIRDRCDGDEFRAIGKKRTEVVENQEAVVCNRKVSQDGAVAFGQLLPWNQVGVVLHRGDNDFVAALHIDVAPAAGNQVDTSGGARREDALAGMLGTDEIADLLACFLVLLGCALAERVDTTVNVGVIALVHATQHLDYLPRPLGAGGVIEEDERPIAVDFLLKNRKVVA